MKDNELKYQLIDLLNSLTEAHAERQLLVSPWQQRLKEIEQCCNEATVEVDKEIAVISQKIIELGLKYGQDVCGRRHSVLIEHIPDIGAEELVALVNGKMSWRKSIEWFPYAHIVAGGRKADN